ncbi:lectin [Nocardia sp. 852002-20019_SCH5090214]|uniref:LysM peptidoglycan-binding domain-containing protein n=2 Tax=Nocardia TaxID=1817 RepID=A0A2S6A421_9NOCA|nr:MULTISPECIES: LysM peptidoglycan-binding domain-containing protein [Nocardia]OBF83233.1 lectin [Mycobacterium sp. 852002-51759_SCH5129042]MBF6245317.1 LysM peptidoglycan-binding domain-containing protein [Nocardia elegans]MBF6274077.1 LysM peptidoglycan-binding domain-containing protein [Nocardia nova]MBF6448443.1 LysM peptidoglycan-binding domain-containing protein [Nocardia elegans]MBV7706652.1 LysM peptidoglycan-binding domain-containing protein [Nocardia nova]
MGDTLQVGEELGLGQALQGGAYTLTLQNDGNLVLSEPDGTVVWATMTHERGVERAVLQEDGNFVLYSGSGPVWATDTNGQAADHLVLQSDRNLVLYGRDGASLWASGTNTDSPIVVEEPVAAPAAEQVPPPPAAPEPRTYTVESGDTLWAIAERFYGDGNRYLEIAGASGIENPDVINEGQLLTIP